MLPIGAVVLVNPCCIQLHAAVVNGNSESATLAMLASFAGLDANGGWTIFVADLNQNGEAKLDSWSLDIVSVPEPGALILLCLGMGTLVIRARTGSTVQQ